MLISLEHLVGTPKVVILPWDLGAAAEREMTFGEIIAAGEILQLFCMHSSSFLSWRFELRWICNSLHKRSIVPDGNRWW